MKAIARSLVVIMVALLAVPALVVSVTITTAVQLLAATALILGGTEHPLSTPPDDPVGFINPYMNQAVLNFIVPGSETEPAPNTINQVAVIYPAEFFPVFGSTTFEDSVADGRSNLGSCLDNDAGGCERNKNLAVEDSGIAVPIPSATEQYYVFGYSQSAVVAALVKQDLIDEYADNPGDAPNVEFYFAANPTRPNGGILGRGFEGFTIPILGIPFYGPAPTDSCEDGGPCFPTTDVAQQYDFLGGDAPARLDPLAFANSIAAYSLLHGNVPNRSIAPGGTDPADPQVIYQGEYGDTDYYMITAPRLPLLMIFEQAGVPGPFLALPDALLRVWIEDKYRRDLSPGEHVQFQLSPIGNPVNLVGNMLGAIPVGIDDTVAQASGNPDNRPLGTANVYRPFGVGGPVYDENGVLTTDNVGIPTGSGDYSLTQAQTLGAPETSDNNKLAVEADQIGNDVTPSDGTETPEATKPEPFAKLRESLKFDPANRPLGVRPSGDGPLKRIVNALTGQRPTPAGAEPEPAKDAA